MKKTLWTLTICAILTLPSGVMAETITLQDGSRINGQVSGMKDGVYTVKSSFGSVAIPAADITSITDKAPIATPPALPPATSNAATTTSSGSQMQAMQAQLMSNPQVMAQIQSMAQDPDIIAALSDPTFVQAVQAQNLTAVQNNPQFQRVLNNPKMRAIIESMKATQ